MDVVQAMLHRKHVPKMFWPDVVKWCVHIQNRSLIAAVESKTSEEAWSGEKLVVEYFKIFGCQVHAHVPDQKKAKLNDKSKTCIFLGVNDESKAWKLYDSISKNQSSLVEMWCLKKRKVGTGANKKFSNRNYIMKMQMIRQE